MKEMTEEEFENLIQEMIDGKKILKEAITEMETDYRTFHRKIMDLSLKNPKLYREYAIKFPYKPKQITHVDYEALLIHVMKSGKTLEQAASELDIHQRTVRRNIKKVDISQRIVELYRVYAWAKRGPSKLPAEIEEEIDELEERSIIIDEVAGKRKRTLIDIRNKLYEDRDVSLAQKSREMGTTYRSSRHRLDELRRIVTEEKETREEKEGER